MFFDKNRIIFIAIITKIKFKIIKLKNFDIFVLFLPKSNLKTCILEKHSIVALVKKSLKESFGLKQGK